MQNTKQIIVLKPFVFKGATSIGIYFSGPAELQQVVRKTKGIKWSQAARCWYIPFERSIYDDFVKNVQTLAVIDSSALRDFKNKSRLALYDNQVSKQNLGNKNQTFKRVNINLVNRHVLPAMCQTLILKSYSQSTIKTYLNEMSQFLQAIKSNTADAFSVERIKSYLQ